MAEDESWWEVSKNEYNIQDKEKKIQINDRENKYSELKIRQDFDIRLKPLSTYSSIFLVGLFFGWDYWGTSGFDMILWFPENLSWYFESREILDPAPNLLQSIHWLLSISLPLILTINLVIVWLTSTSIIGIKTDKYSTTGSVIHFSLFAIYFFLEVYLWNDLGALFTQSWGLYLGLIGGLGISPWTTPK